MKNKKRLDEALVELHPDLSRQQVQSMIMQGLVTVNGKMVTKPGHQVTADASLLLNKVQEKYVSRAGYKLEAALVHFDIDVKDCIALDAGLSTGGFADCLLQHGASKIYGVDVGYGQVHEKVRNDPRVIVMERTNLRYLTDLPEKVDVVTLDLSFISVLKVMDVIVSILKSGGKLIVLIKPQFEAGRQDIGRGGIVRDEAVHQRVVESLQSGIEHYGFVCKGVIESPILGATGNKEFLAYFIKQ